MQSIKQETYQQINQEDKKPIQVKNNDKIVKPKKQKGKTTKNEE